MAEVLDLSPRRQGIGGCSVRPERHEVLHPQRPRSRRRVGQGAQEGDQPPCLHPTPLRGLQGSKPTTRPDADRERRGERLVPSRQRPPSGVEDLRPAILTQERHDRAMNSGCDQCWFGVCRRRVRGGPARVGAATSACGAHTVPGGCSSPTTAAGADRGSSQPSGTSAIRVSISNSPRAWR